MKIGDVHRFKPIELATDAGTSNVEWVNDTAVRDYDWAVVGSNDTPNSAALVSDASPSTYELDSLLSMRIPTCIFKRHFINADMKSMNLTIGCTNVRNPAVTAASPSATLGDAKLVIYDSQYKQLLTSVNQDSFSEYSQGLPSAIGPVSSCWISHLFCNVYITSTRPAWVSSS